MLGRMRKAADGVAATETRAQVTFLFGVRNPVPNGVDGVRNELDRGTARVDTADVDLARAMQKELGDEGPGPDRRIALRRRKRPAPPTSRGQRGRASSKWVATRPLGTASHHWAQTSCAAHPIGYKGMMVAAKVLAASAVDLLGDAKLVEAAKADFQKETKGAPYVSPIPPDAKPKPF